MITLFQSDKKRGSRRDTKSCHGEGEKKSKTDSFPPFGTKGRGKEETLFSVSSISSSPPPATFMQKRLTAEEERVSPPSFAVRQVSVDLFLDACLSTGGGRRGESVFVAFPPQRSICNTGIRDSTNPKIVHFLRIIKSFFICICWKIAPFNVGNAKKGFLVFVPSLPSDRSLSSSRHRKL